MNLRHTTIILLFGIIIPLVGNAQVKISGIVKDIKTRKGLPFATVMVENTPNHGTTTNLNGEFKIIISSNDKTFSINYVGYEKTSYKIKEKEEKIEVYLTPSDYTLNEITIFPSENPAHRIINNAIANADKNNPDMNAAYTCRIYNKTTLAFNPNSKSKGYQRLKSMSDSMNLLITESVTDRFYGYKDNVEEKVVANRVSGFSNPNFALTTSLFQPFHFYNTYITLLDKQLLNPISTNSTKNYFFLLKDTLVTGNDTTFVIEFKPRKNTNFEGLKGFISINTNGWAIQNVVAERARKANINLKFEQQYALHNNRWFPKEYRYKLELIDYPPGFGSSYYEGFGTVYDVSISLTPIGMKKNLTSIADSAGKAVATIYSYRSHALTKKDSTTYRYYNETSLVKKIDRIQEWMEYLGQLKIPTGIFCIPITSIYSSNRYEKSRFGLGIETNRRVSNYFTLGGYFAYGINDDGWKYGANLSLYPKKNHITSLTYSYKNDLAMPTTNFLVNQERNKIVNRFLLDKADKTEEHKVEVKTRIGALDYVLAVKHVNFAPTYSYMYNNIQQKELHSNNFEVSATIRWGIKEKESRFFNLSLFESQNYPVIGINIRKGMKALDGSYSYTGIEAGIFKKFDFRKAGSLRVTALGGYLNGKIPYSLLFGTNGTNTGYMPLLVNNAFNCAKPFEFAANSYSSLFLYYDLGSLLYNSKKFRPTVSLFQAAGVSTLNDPAQYQNLNIRDMKNGYFESGVLIGNILRVKLLNIFYAGFGGGAFIAYGDAAKKPVGETLTYKLKVDIDF